MAEKEQAAPTGRIVAYIKEQREVTIPALQRRFSADYFTVARLVRRLVDDGELKFAGGVTYTVTGAVQDGAVQDKAEEIARRRASLEERRQQLIARAMKTLRSEDGEDVSPAEEAEEHMTVRAEELVVGGDGRWEDGLLFAVGRGAGGELVYGDLSRLAHILIGGGAGMGKSSFLHTMIYSFLMHYTPDEVRLILCDPKRTEFTLYEDMPHLLTGEVLSEVEQAIPALRWAIVEMERRYGLFAEKTAAGEPVRDIAGYNAVCAEGERLPRIVIIVDEFADLILQAKRDIEDCIQRLAQKSRAAGIHLVLATFMTSVTVMTGAVKCNFPTRVAFRVYEELQSRVILDERGAEKLPVRGDMLMKGTADLQGRRIRAAYTSREELAMAVSAAKTNYPRKFHKQAQTFIARTGQELIGERRGGPMYPEDESCIKALKVVIEAGEASICLVQRRCGVGYNHAAKIIEWMEDMGYVSRFDETMRTRAVLITKEKFEKLYGPLG